MFFVVIDVLEGGVFDWEEFFDLCRKNVWVHEISLHSF